MPLQTESRQQTKVYPFVNDIHHMFDAPLKKYLVDFGDYVDITEATNMTADDRGIVFENSVIRDCQGNRIGVGRTFIEHHALVGVTLIEHEYGSIVINNETKLSLFGVG